MRTVRLLIPLSFLLHNVCPDLASLSPPADSTSKIPPAVTSEWKSVTRPNAAQAQSTAAVTIAVKPPMIVTANPHDLAEPQPQPTRNKAALSHVTISSAQPSTANPAATLTPDPKVPITTAALSTTFTKLSPTKDHGGRVVGFLTTAKVLTTEASTPSKTSVVLTSFPNHVETANTTKFAKSSTAGQSRTQPATTFNMNKGEKITTTIMRNEQKASWTLKPSGKPESPRSQPSLTSTQSHVSETEGASLQTTTSMAMNTEPLSKIFQYSLNRKYEIFTDVSYLQKEEDKELMEVCKRVMINLQDGTCTLTWRYNNGKVQFDTVEINGKVKTSVTTQYYEEISKKPPDNKTLIAILASCGTLLIMIFILVVCASHHRRPHSENQQHLTEELHAVENSYHDNPTLEVMEVQPEMQEKKAALNGEFSDSWIVPIDNLLKENIPDEEDTHL